MQIMKTGKRETTEGTELPKKERIWILGEKKNYKYLRVLEADTIKQPEMKEKNKKRVPQKKEKTSRNQVLQ